MNADLKYLLKNKNIFYTPKVSNTSVVGTLRAFSIWGPLTLSYTDYHREKTFIKLKT